jgi:hypothetical protein
MDRSRSRGGSRVSGLAGLVAGAGLKQSGAPWVKLTQVPAGTLGAIDATEPFGWWVAFVPRSAGYPPLEVIAYGAGGDRLGTPFTLRNR